MVALDVPLNNDAPAKARAALEPLRTSMPRQDFGDLRLMISELIVDDLRAAHEDDATPIRLAADVRGQMLRVELSEGWPAVAAGRARRPAPGEPGWGIYLTGVLADRWGFDDDGPRRMLWVEKRVASGSG